MTKSLSVISSILLLLNIILLFKGFTKKNKPLKIFVSYLIISLLFQIITTIMNRLKLHNLFLSHYYFIFQFLMLSYFYFNILKSIKIKKIIKAISALVICSLILQYSLHPETYFIFNVFEIVICSIPLVLYSFLFFNQNIMNDFKNDFIYLNSGVFIYLLSSTLLFAAGNYVSTSVTSWNRFIWTFNTLLYLVYQILIFVEWYKNFRSKKDIHNNTFIKR